MTVLQRVNHLGLNIEDRERMKLGVRLAEYFDKAYPGAPFEKLEETHNACQIKVRVYPEYFYPEMDKIISTPEKKKRARLTAKKIIPNG